MAKTKTLKLVVVRSYSAGVHVGLLVSSRDSGGRLIVELRDARRLWRWRGANSLHEVATAGVAQEWTRLSEPVGAIVVADVTEILPVAPAAIPSLTASRWAT